MKCLVFLILASAACAREEPPAPAPAPAPAPVPEPRSEALLRGMLAEPGDRERVLELLAGQSMRDAELKELFRKFRLDPEASEELARAWLEEGGSPETYGRALTLVKLLKLVTRSWVGETWWRWSRLQCEIYLAYGEEFDDPAALANVVRLVTDWESLGVLKDSPYAEEMRELRRRAGK